MHNFNIIKTVILTQLPNKYRYKLTFCFKNCPNDPFTKFRPNYPKITSFKLIFEAIHYVTPQISNMGQNFTEVQHVRKFDTNRTFLCLFLRNVF